MAKIKSEMTGNIYEGGLSFHITPQGRGQVWVGDRILVTYEDVDDIEQLAKLVKEDYEFIDDKSKRKKEKLNEVL